MELGDARVLVTGGGSGLVLELPGRVVGFEADVSSEPQVEALVAKSQEALGGLNVLVNNAGIFRDGLLVSRHRGSDTKPAVIVNVSSAARGLQKRSTACSRSSSSATTSRAAASTSTADGSSEGRRRQAPLDRMGWKATTLSSSTPEPRPWSGSTSEIRPTSSCRAR